MKTYLVLKNNQVPTEKEFHLEFMSFLGITVQSCNFAYETILIKRKAQKKSIDKYGYNNYLYVSEFQTSLYNEIELNDIDQEWSCELIN